ncbi:MAG: hypothetical protein Harvfovirus11_19 [Harvfovirus sp.]|uniref:Minor capsid protein P9 transmembrane helices domain-containing protein n=1 Tax=Harvfovirus sp. TaxID=2487768 RepID=A0A3G5A166_9VIRU|nr:MAG: hypothetical protein Harvfovirus11_19 [Harvfovirus sp.]
MTNIFWVNDPSVLYSNGNYLKIIPTEDMSPVQKLNAITCACIYIFLIVLIFTSALVIPILLIIVIIIFYYFSTTGTTTKNDSVKREHMLNKKKSKKRYHSKKKKKKLNIDFDKNLFMDVDTLYQVSQSERMTSGGRGDDGVPDTTGFGNWLWDNKIES